MVAMQTEAMTISELAGRLRLNPRTLRYYERIGLLPEPERTGAGYRLYGPADEERLRFIKAAQRVGLTLGEVRETLAFRERGEPPCCYIAERLDERLDEIDRRLRELRAAKHELGALRQRIREHGPIERPDGYCHYLADRPRD